MKQVIQSYRTGKVELVESPVPHCGSKSILVRNICSLISIGTERMTIEVGQKSLIGKARARPDLVKRVIDKARNDGVVNTFHEVMGRLDNPIPLGYSSAGVVVATGTAATEYASGDRVACIGQGFASHAEFVAVPVNMTCSIPVNVSNAEASFAMLGAIALHGIRMADLSFGSTVVVIGLGLLGLLTAQMLKAYGCRVIAYDLVEAKTKLAMELGADIVAINRESLTRHVAEATANCGVDACILTAASQSSEPVELAVDLLRCRGKVVVVGTSEIKVDRNEMWRKEVEIVVSRAGGPGSFDDIYEKDGIDLPIDQVRWTLNRNVQEFLRLVSIESVKVDPLISHRYKFGNAEQAYSDIMDNKIHPIGVVFEYEEATSINRLITLSSQQHQNLNKVSLTVVGAGLFGKSILLPQLSKKPNVHLHTVVTSSGYNAQHIAKKFKFMQCSTDANAAVIEPGTHAVIILTPHSTHTNLIIKAIKTGKSVFVEKPLCTNIQELHEVMSAYDGAAVKPIIMVGHNRRYSPHIQKIKAWLGERKNPLVLSLRANVGYVDSSHWVHKEQEGRSRIIGEMTHYIDLIQYLTNAAPMRVFAERISSTNQTTVNNDNVIINLKLSDGSVANLVYSASGNRSYSRESLEIFSAGSVMHSIDYRQTMLHSATGKQKFKTFSKQMGYSEELSQFVNAVSGRAHTVPEFNTEIVTMQTVFAIEESLALGRAVVIATIVDRNSILEESLV